MKSVTNLLEEFKRQDIYSVLCSYLFNLKDAPEYALFSELAYLLDSKSFVNFITYFEGETIKVPTVEEFQESIKILLLLQYYKVENNGWKESLRKAGFQTNEGRSAQNKLNKLINTLEQYNYGNRDFK